MSDYYLCELDQDNVDLLIDVLTTTIALAEDDERAAMLSSIRLVSVGTPLLECLRKARKKRAEWRRPSLSANPIVLPQCKRYTL